MSVLAHSLIPGVLFLVGVYAAYKIGYGNAIHDVGRTITDLRAEAHFRESWYEEEIAAARETPFDWDDAPDSRPDFLIGNPRIVKLPE
jgi:hypothetical protein